MKAIRTADQEQVDRLYNRVQELDELKRSTVEELRTTRLLLAKLTCPFEIDQVTTSCGYVHRGKKLSIFEIAYEQFYNEYVWVVIGHVLKKDGTPSEHVARFNAVQYDTYKKAAGCKTR